MSFNISPIRVDGEGPLDANLVCIGEAPGVTEEKEGRPFVGESGNKLEAVLRRNGLERAEVRLENLSPYRPKGNRFELLLGTPELATSVQELYARLRSINPTVICTLGNWPTWFFTGKGKVQKKNKTVSGILNWRGSILRANVEGLDHIKVIPTIHPAAILRDPVLYPTFDQDIKRVKADLEFRELRLPERQFVIAPKGAELEQWTNTLLTATKLAVDIENVKDTSRLLCVGFAMSSQLGVCFEYDEHDPLLRDCLYRLLSSPIPKVFHFGTHDTEILRLNGYSVNNYAWDTLLSQHVMWPELPRSLAYLTSILTREPYYKDEVKEEDSDTKAWSAVWAAKRDKRQKLYSYNCKDTCCTYEISDIHEREIAEGPAAWKRFLEFEMSMLEPFHAIMQAGMLVDEIRMAEIRNAVEARLAEQQAALNTLLGVPEACAKRPCRCGKCINVNSPKQISAILYDALALPKRTKRGSDGESKVTTEEHALVSLIAVCKEKVDTLVRPQYIAEWKKKLLVVKLIILIRGGRKMKSSYLDIRISDDKRLRSRYKVGGTETGRSSAEKYVDNTGANGQTFPRGGVEVAT